MRTVPTTGRVRVLEVRRLRVFAAVAEHRSLTAAAEALAVPHPVVARQLALLERQLGVALTVRGPDGVELTDAGELLTEHATGLLGSVATIERELRELTRCSATVRLGAFPTAAAELIPRVLREFGTRHPDVQVRLRSTPAADVPAALRDGDVELGLVWDYDFLPRAVPPDVELLPLVDDPLLVLLPADHPFAGESEVDLAEFAGDPWVVRGHRPPYDEAFATMCRLAGFEPEIGFVTEDYLSAQGLVAAGVGVGIVPRLALVAVRPDVAAVPLAGGPHRRIAAVRLKGTEPTEAATWLLDVLGAVTAGER